MASPESARRAEQPSDDQEKESKPKFDLEALSSEIAEPPTVERETTPERLAEVKEAVSEGIDLSYEGLLEDYEEPSEKRKDKELLFHNRAHSEGVVRRTESVLKAIYGDDQSPETGRKIELGKLVAAFHDRMNESEIVEVPDPANAKADGTPFMKKMRKRFTDPKMRDELRVKQARAEVDEASLSETDKKNLNALETLGMLGTNELDSAKELLAFLKDKKGADGSPLFTEDDMATVYESLAATVPDWDVKMGTVKQINLQEGSNEVPRALALADLGEAGTDPESYLNAGDALFLEDNPDVADAVRNPDKYDDETKAYFAKRIIGFTKSQSGFAVGRKNRMDQELAGLAPDAQERVKTLFDKFGEDEVEFDDKGKVKGLKTDKPAGSIGRAFQVGQARENMSFDMLREQVLANAEAHKKNFKGQE